MNNLLNIALPVFYFALVWAYGKAFFSDKAWAKHVKRTILVSTIAVHLFALAYRTMVFRHPPVTTVFEIFTVLACSITVTYFIIELRTQRKETGYFILNLAFFFQLASSIFIKDTPVVPEILRSPLFGIHVSFALIGYAAITIAGAYGLMYLMLYHEMKAVKFGVIYKKLPTLETMERMTFTAVKLAFLLLGVAILFGFIWLHQAIAHPNYFDPKLVGTIIVWAMYAFLVIAKTRYSWKGRKVMILSILGFLISLFSMTIINIFFSAFHKFY
ncbi:MAG: cytochrome C biogenesis protein [Ignavibacteriae bacterium]|nr:MAG: cytochrome C biogenesis protein [Ignavibacteriota bacterium]